MKRTQLLFIPSGLAGKLLAMGCVGLLALATGCTTEKTVNPKQVALTQQPVLDPKLKKEDFAFPSRPPRLSQGQKIFNQNCASCHTGGTANYSKIKSQKPIDQYLLLTRGDNNHPVFKNMTRDQRWEAVFYYRYIAGEGKFTRKKAEVDSIFGANCAVCHGSKGFADGPLYTGHASAHELGMAPVKNAFYPPPANFHSYGRMYNRTNDQLVKFINEGIYPSAMPSWKGRVDKDRGFVFDDPLILDLVKVVRSFGYENDLPASQDPFQQGGSANRADASAKSENAAQ